MQKTKSNSNEYGNKVVGIIIPIYNVEKYLRECLESILHQTYKNLEILLINDGSTDSSLQIAKEYAQKDSRITIIDKENGGQANARNAGIEFFSGELVAITKESTKDADSLHSYQIIGENLYQIHTIYSLKSSLEIPIIDYLQFVDSDDYIELDCVEQCVKRMRGVDVLWFDFQRKYEGNLNYDSAKKPTPLTKYGFCEECKITPAALFTQSKLVERKWYAFTWQGMLDFRFLQAISLKFANVPLEEDHHFWLLLLAQSQCIFIFPQKLYFYRIHPHSMTNYGGKTGLKNIPKQLQCYLKDFCGNPMLLHKYCRAGSAATMLGDIFRQMESGKIEPQTCAILKQNILNRLCMLAMNLESFQADPMGFLPLLAKIKPYAKEQKIGAYALLHQSLEYQLGLATLSSFKSISNFLKSFGVIYRVLQRYKKLKNIENANSLQDYWDFKESEHLKKHLSFRIGRKLTKLCFD
ncbi:MULTISPECIES: glycosyltransferase family 2 protein [Helicobacter]|uniref:Glycosyl transferase n=2 Tax=Helicobacter ganmani TaxID=60246 RepID=A0A3D8I9B8_9HELI|nr:MULTISPECIES: glycosyltransferase family 2 protein [Helicobacter]RDU61615.1 glycosyl transferase [Helicobacter ganmani]